MATFKPVVLAHQKRADNTYNIKIRVTHNRQSKYISTPYYLTPADLTRSLNIKNAHYSDLCNNLIRTYRDRLEPYGMAVKNFTIEQVLQIVQTDNTFHLDLMQWTETLCTRLRNDNRIATANNYISSVKSLYRFIQVAELDINEITAEMLNNFQNYMFISVSEKNGRKRKIGAFRDLCVLQSIYQQAIKEFNQYDLDVIKIPKNPFQYIKKIKPKSNPKFAINAEQIKQVQGDISHPVSIIAGDVFLLSFLLIGINAIDLYTLPKSAYKNGRLTYCRHKTQRARADRAEISIAVPEQALPLFEKYKGDRDYLFSFSKMYKTNICFNMALNNGLKYIGKKIGLPDLRFYSARHSWATIAYNDCNVDKYSVHLALNHIDQATAITDVYIRKDWSMIDRANEKVIDFVFGNKKSPDPHGQGL